MATYYVNGASGSDSNTGTSASPWATLNKANTAAAAGDTIKVRTATYYEQITFTKANLTVEADTGHTPTIDGRYHPGLFGAAGFKNGNGGAVGNDDLPYNGEKAAGDFNYNLGNWTVRSDTAAIVVLNGAGVKIKGFIIRNSAGRLLSFKANNTIAENCIMDFCYGGAVVFTEGANTKMTGCTVTRSSMKEFDPTRDVAASGKKPVTTTVIIKQPCPDAIVEYSTVCYNYGEGVSADKGSVRPIIRYNTIHTNAHWSMGFNHTSGAKFYGNVLFWCENLMAEMTKDTPGDLFVGGSERASENNPSEAPAPDTYIYNNLFVGGKRCMVFGGDSRPVSMQRSYIGYNTFIGRPNSGHQYLFLWQSLDSAPHSQTVMENNILWAGTGRRIDIRNNGTVTWRNNLTNAAPPPEMNGNGHVTVDANASTMNNPLVAITGTYNHKSTALPSVTTSFNAANYNLTNSSAAIGRASNRSNPYGWNLPTVNIDRVGDGRTDYNAGQGRYYDIGQDEFGGSAPPPDDDTVTASFNRTPGSGDAPLTVNYTDTSTATGDAVIDSWLWQFGDGTTSTNRNPVKVYATAGTYTTTLTVQDVSLGLSSSFTGGSVTVTAPPTGTVTARYTRTPAAAEVGDTITFTDTSTTTGAAVIDSWSWNFRDGTTSTLENPTHVFTAAGTYAVRLTVQDTALGLSHTWTGPDTVITAAPPDDAVEASFTQSATAGAAPLAVTFTDTSQEAGTAAINSWSWDFGDGSGSTSQNPVKTYATAGSYTPKLTVQDTVLGLNDVYVGQTITVTVDEPPPVGGDVVLRQVRAALNTADGQQTFTNAGLGGVTPKRARFIVTAATSDGTAANGELLCVGATAGGNEWAACIAAAHNVATTTARRMWTDEACILLIDADGNEVLRATFVAWTADGVTVNLDWTGTPAAYLVTVEFGAGTEYQAWVGTAALGVANSNTVVTTGFAPDAARAVATWGARDSAETDATISLGMSHRFGGEYCLERYYATGLTDAANRTRLNSNEIVHSRYNTAGRGSARVTTWSSNGLTLNVVDSDLNSTALLLVERFGSVASRVALVSSATATGNTDYGLTFDPQYVEHLISPRQGEGSNNDNALSGTIGLHTVTADGEYSNQVSGENGAATTNEQSLSDNQLIVVGHTGTTLAAGATTLGTLKYTINFSTAPATAQKWPSLAVQEGQAEDPGGDDFVTAEFTADVVEGVTPLRVRFTDLSSATNPITTWAWDFGDGQAATTQNPSHIYREDGPFAVSLTVSDGTLSDTITKEGYISPRSIVARRVIIGPYFLRPISEATAAATHSDPADETNAGYMDGETAFNVLPVNADPEEPAALTGEWQIYADTESGDIKVKFPDGTIGTVSVT